MITISFYSYKGGVGRSLALTNLGVYLAQFGATVAMVDFDLEAPGLHYKIAPGRPLAIESRGLAGLLADVSCGRGASEIEWDLAIDVSEHAAESDGDANHSHGQLLLVPAGNPLRPEYWSDLGSLDWDGLFTGSRRPGVEALHHFRQTLVEKHNPDVLLVDSRTGITPGGGVSTTLLPDYVVTLLLNTPEHLDGTRLVVSAVTSSGTAEAPSPRIIPVLSRYTTEAMHVPAGRQRLAPSAIDGSTAEEADHIRQVHATLVEGLPADSAASVEQPLLLRTDLALQQSERLAFGPHAGATGQALLDDYIRLFAALVPREMFLRHTTAVRNRARATLLDRPDEAVRALETLASLVGDEAVFIDLVKAYVLRRDVPKLVSAAERLFRVHGRIVVHPALTAVLRERTGHLRPRTARDSHRAMVEFLEQYWKEAAPDDVEWGARVAQTLADAEMPARSRELADQLIGTEGDAHTLAVLVGMMATGGSTAEVVAATLALDYFDKGAGSEEFLAAAAQAAAWEPNARLAARVLDAPRAGSLDSGLLVSLLLAAGHTAQAGDLLLNLLSEADPDDHSEAVNEHQEQWFTLIARHPDLRRELEARNPAVARSLEASGFSK